MSYYFSPIGASRQTWRTISGIKKHFWADFDEGILEECEYSIKNSYNNSGFDQRVEISKFHSMRVQCRKSALISEREQANRVSPL